MSDHNKPKNEKVSMGEVANRNLSKPESIDNQNAELIEVPQEMPKSVLQVSEETWIAGTKSLQRNLINGLQEYQTGIFQFKQRAEFAQKRSEMIKKVTDEYIRFLKEEARLASDAALEARQTVLSKELTELKASMYLEISDMVGISVVEIEKVFQKHFNNLTDETIKQRYAQFVIEKIFDLLDLKADRT